MKDDFGPTPPRVKTDMPSRPKLDTLPEPEPAFLPPEVIAEQMDAETEQDSEVAEKPHKRFSFGPLTRKQIIIFSAVFGLLIASGTVYWFFIRKKPAPPPVAAIVEPPKPEPKPEPAPTTGPSKLTGLEIPLEQNELPITGIMIENSPDARPQAGLKDAGIVVEMLVEGGISRFLTLWHNSGPDYIGPVRSVRPPYLDFVMAFDAAIAHAGGSGQALAEIRSFGIKDMDHGANGGSFHRVSNRYAPHNLYTSFNEMINLQKQKGYKSNPTPLARKKEVPSASPTARTVDVTLSSFFYNSHWDYSAANNSYLRSQAGKPHLDERSGAQIASKAVVMLVMSHSYGGIYSVYGTTGSGKAYVFQDGNVTEGTWTKAERKSPLVLKDASGAALGLNPGNTWITLVASPGAVIFKP